VTCRGNERRSIFLSDIDRSRFLALLREEAKSYSVVLHAYVLMNNHFHLLVQTRAANLAEFMRCFSIRYTAWFNRHHERCGHLFQGRYRAQLVDTDAYLLEASRYLHLNPVRAARAAADTVGRWNYLQTFRWSSLPGYLNGGLTHDYVDHDLLLSLAGSRRAYREFVRDGLRRGVKSPFKGPDAILGGDEFVRRVTTEYVKAGSALEQPRYRVLTSPRAEPQVVMSCVADIVGTELSKLLLRSAGGVARGIACELLHRHAGLKEAEIAALLGGIHYSAVSQLRRRLRERMTQDRSVAHLYEAADTELRRLMSNVKI
jgi:REP element-mobilizing transposase RayT